MNYQIITNEEYLQDFVDNFLPEISPDETFYVCLFSRSKYCKGIAHINSDKSQLKRFTTNKSRLIDKLKQLECPLGSYKQKLNVSPQESLAVYINPNPRSNIKAAKNGLIRLAHLVTGENHGYNLHQEMISEVQKAKSRTCFVDFDFDLNDEFLLLAQDERWMKNLIDINVEINQEAYHILKTRGGYHILVEPEKVAYEFKNKWFNSLKKAQQIYSTDTDNHGDNMIPIPGTYQGGFTPHFIKK